MPGFSSWSGCTPFTGCQGCSITNATKEQFPIFHALLNAVHVQKATVRILTNNYNTPTCPGKVRSRPSPFAVIFHAPHWLWPSTSLHHLAVRWCSRSLPWTSWH